MPTAAVFGVLKSCLLVLLALFVLGSSLRFLDHLSGFCFTLFPKVFSMALYFPMNVFHVLEAMLLAIGMLPACPFAHFSSTILTAPWKSRTDRETHADACQHSVLLLLFSFHLRVRTCFLLSSWTRRETIDHLCVLDLVAKLCFPPSFHCY